MISEDLLHFAWKYALFEHSRLILVQGESLEILSAGKHNTDSGPDFQDARLKINGMHWAGNVEIHVKASDWLRHGHEDDPAYGTVILHVVLIQDAEIKDMNGIPIPTLELENRISKTLGKRWEELQQASNPIPCSRYEVPDAFTLGNWMDRLVAERLEEKARRVEESLRHTINDWDQCMYSGLARSFGFKVNALPFEMLAQSLPVSLIKKYTQSRFQLEALFFGQSGLLNGELEDDYPKQLWEEYEFLRRKHKLTPLQPHIWKFLRLRPVNFPPIRIAQFAALMDDPAAIFKAILLENGAGMLMKMFEVEINPYWQNHYQFDLASALSPKKIGRKSIEGILINTVAPLLFIYGKHYGEERMQERAISLLYKLKPEENALLKDWNRMGIQADSAAASQALIHLRTEYCDVLRCLECSLGHRLLKSTGSELVQLSNTG